MKVWRINRSTNVLIWMVLFWRITDDYANYDKNNGYPSIVLTSNQPIILIIMNSDVK